MASTTSSNNPTELRSRLSRSRIDPRQAASESDRQQESNPSAVPIPSSSTEGFFQTPPRILNQLSDDVALRRAVSLFLPESIRTECSQDIKTLGDKALSKPVLDSIADAEKNLPYLKTWDAFGRRQDELITSEGWRKLSAIGQQEGMVATGYDNDYLQFSRTQQFLKYLVWCGSAVWTTCPNQMTDGVASLLRKHLSDSSLEEQTRSALQSAYDRVTSRDPEFAWTTGQWMTERQGGSDVSQTETLATYTPELSARDAEAKGSDGVPLGPWLCSGFKWFSSATDSQMMVFLARTPKGISTFMAPMRRTVSHDHASALPSRDLQTELNGVQIQRLKNKLGTKALPTAELVLKDVRAHLIGEEGNGVKEMATVLNISRIHNGITAIGFWGRGLSVIRAFARVRKVGLKPLLTKPAFVRTLARMHAEYRANVLLGGLVWSLLGVVEQSEIRQYRAATHSSSEKVLSPTATDAVPDPQAAQHLFRLLAPVLKGICGKSAIAGLAECMECMGGVGYLESEDMQFNIARLFRDTNVIPIWEGTTDMMADDVRRVMFGKTSKEVMHAMDYWIEHVLEHAASNSQLVEYSMEIKNMWRAWKARIQSYEREEVELRARDLMEKLANVVMGALMILDASKDSDPIAIDAVNAWCESISATTFREQSAKSWREIAARDMRIVFGNEDVGEVVAKL